MRILPIALTVLAVLTLQACENPDRYPLSGEACSPNDPVQELNAEACKSPA